MRIQSLLLLATLFSACRSITPAGTTIASSPPGAYVLVDGKEIGFVTPCIVDLDDDDAHELTVSLPGYESRTVQLRPQSRTYFVPWKAGTAAQVGIRFPLFLTPEDAFTPYRKDSGPAPARIYVRLVPMADS